MMEAHFWFERCHDNKQWWCEDRTSVSQKDIPLLGAFMNFAKASAVLDLHKVYTFQLCMS